MPIMRWLCVLARGTAAGAATLGCGTGPLPKLTPVLETLECSCAWLVCATVG